MTPRYAQIGDLFYLSEADPHLGRAAIELKISRREIFLIADDEVPIGFLRFGLMYDVLPFMSLLRIEETHRRRGFGTKLVTAWEDEMRRLGHEEVMTSTNVDEEAQHFYRALGYRDCGGILLSEDESLELFLRKVL